MSASTSEGVTGPLEIIEVDGDSREVLGLAKALDRASAIALASLMSEISEDCWCASWLTGLGFSLWERTQYGGPSAWGQGEVNASHLNRLLDLAVKAGGWWHWPQVYDGLSYIGELTFYALDEWAALCMSRAKCATGVTP